jgi:hypothetical protein
VIFGAVLVVEAAALAAGVARLQLIAPEPRDSIRVGVAASDPDIPAFRTDRREQADCSPAWRSCFSWSRRSRAAARST